MLAIRLQRIGRKKLPMYRVAVQESHRHPSSGRVVTYVGSFDPHTKKTIIDKEKVAFYLQNGAQPSPRIVRLLEAEKIELPNWIKKAAEKKRAIRNPEKLRKNNPAPQAEAQENSSDQPSEEIEEATKE